MSGAIPPLYNTHSWRGAQLKSTGTNLPLTFMAFSRSFQESVGMKILKLSFCLKMCNSTYVIILCVTTR
jgi:hypothetical protein